MRQADPTETKKFGKAACVKSVLVFLANYLILLLFLLLFLWMGTFEQEQTLKEYILNNYNMVIYLLSSIFLLFLTIYFYYIFEDRSLLATVKVALFAMLALPFCSSMRMKLASNCGAMRNPPKPPEAADSAAVPAESRLIAS